MTVLTVLPEPQCILLKYLSSQRQSQVQSRIYVIPISTTPVKSRLKLWSSDSIGIVKTMHARGDILLFSVNEIGINYHDS